MNVDVFPIENGRFPNVMLVNSGVETHMKANRISMGASVLELCKNTRRNQHFHFHYLPLFLFLDPLTSFFWNEKSQVVEFFIELRLRTSMPAYSPFVQPPGSQRIEGGSRGLSDLTNDMFVLRTASMSMNQCWAQCGNEIKYTVYGIWYVFTEYDLNMHQTSILCNMHCSVHDYIYTHDLMIYILP